MCCLSLFCDLVVGFGVGIVLVWLVVLLIGWIVLCEELDEIYDVMLLCVVDYVLISIGQFGFVDVCGVFWVELIGLEGEVWFCLGGLDGVLLLFIL